MLRVIPKCEGVLSLVVMSKQVVPGRDFVRQSMGSVESLFRGVILFRGVLYIAWRKCLMIVKSITRLLCLESFKGT